MANKRAALTYRGQSGAVCERCMVRCQGWHEDRGGARVRLVICQICGNGDPQLDLDDCGLTKAELDANLRFMRFMKGEDPDENGGDIRYSVGCHLR